MNVKLEKYGTHFERWFFQEIQKYFKMASCRSQPGIHIMSHSHESSHLIVCGIHHEVWKNGDMLMKNISMGKKTKFVQKSDFKISEILLKIQLYEVLLWLVKSVIQSKLSYAWIIYKAVDKLGSMKMAKWDENMTKLRHYSRRRNIGSISVA